MKLICSPSALGQALQVVSRAISTRTTLPILNNVLLETVPSGLALTATNLEISIRKLVSTTVLEEGRTTVPARLITDFVASLPDEDLELSLDEPTQNLSLRCGRFDTHVKCIEADEFPPSPRPDGGDRLTLPLEDMLLAIEQTQIAASTDEARPILTGILFRMEGPTQTLAATDGHRLAVKTIRASEAGALEASLVVPARALGEFSRVFKGEAGELEVVVAQARNQVFFKAGTSEVTSRLIDGAYPNYTQVIPKNSSTSIKAPIAELSQTLKAVSLFARDSANVVRLKAGDGSISLSATTNEVGDSRADVAADVEGSEIQIAFNARYLLDSLTALGGERAELQLDGPLSPGVIKVPGSDDYLYVIMPVRVAM
ncbi:MAG: DNA polymerase III subunit beta [Candidatus Dormibacterales bacterium]